MNSIFNDPLIKELIAIVTSENVALNKLQILCNKVKLKVLYMGDQNENMLQNLRYGLHLKNELVSKKTVILKKKLRPNGRSIYIN